MRGVAVLFSILSFVVSAIIIATIFGGCYATCKPPEARAAGHGVVLDCNMDRMDARREVCRVSTESGDKDFRYVRCQ